MLQNLCQTSAESFENNFYWRTMTFEALYFQTLGTIFVGSIEILVGIWNKKVKAHFWSVAKVALRFECLTKNLDLELILVCIVLIYGLKLGPNFLLDKIIICKEYCHYP